MLFLKQLTFGGGGYRDYIQKSCLHLFVTAEKGKGERDVNNFLSFQFL